MASHLHAPSRQLPTLPTHVARRLPLLLTLQLVRKMNFHTDKPFVMCRPAGESLAAGSSLLHGLGEHCKPGAFLVTVHFNINAAPPSANPLKLSCEQPGCASHLLSPLPPHPPHTDITVHTSYESPEAAASAAATVHDKQNMGKLVRYYLRFDDGVVSGWPGCGS